MLNIVVSYQKNSCMKKIKLYLRLNYRERDNSIFQSVTMYTDQVNFFEFNNRLKADEVSVDMDDSVWCFNPLRVCSSEFLSQ